MKYSKEQHEKLLDITSKYKLEYNGAISKNYILNFLDGIEESISELKTYLEFVASCPYQVGQPVIHEDEVYLVNTTSMGYIGNETKWIELSVINKNGKLQRFKIDEVKLFNKHIKEIVE